MDIANVNDNELLEEIGRRFKEKQSSIEEMEFLTKKLLDMNEKNQKAQEVKSQFLSLVKNEFNNPISNLLNVANMLTKVKDISKLNAMGQILRQDLIKIDFSLKNIFAASEIEAGEIANDYNHINIKEIFNEVIGYFDLLIEDKGLHVKIVNEIEDTFVSDSHKIYLILLNLLSNACEFSYPNKDVTLYVKKDENGYILILENFGEGISKDHDKEIYNRFVHFETGHTRATAGLGLGLSVARGMCEALDGKIDNIHEKEATHFIVYLPKVDESKLNLSQAFGSNEFLFDDVEDGGMMEF